MQASPLSLRAHQAREGTREHTTMTMQQYLVALKKLGLKPAAQETAATLGLSVRHLIRIANDQAPVPEPVANYLRLRLAMDKRLPLYAIALLLRDAQA